jgi:hypothetical protein
MPIGIANDTPERCGRDGTDLVSSLWCESLDWDGVYHGAVG